MKSLFDNPAYRAAHIGRATAQLSRLHQDPRFQTGASERGKKLFEDEAFVKAFRAKSRKAVIAMHAKPGFAASLAESMRQKARKLWQDQSFRDRRSKFTSEHLKRQWKDEAYRKKMRGVLERPEVEKKRADANRAWLEAQWKNPVYREKLRRERSKQMREQWKNPVYREKMVARLRAITLEISRMHATATVPGGWEGRVRTPVHVPNIEASIDFVWKLRKAIDRDLSPLHRFLVCHVFGIDATHEPEVLRDAASLSKEQWQRELNAAYDTLKQNPVIKEIIEE